MKDPQSKEGRGTSWEFITNVVNIHISIFKIHVGLDDDFGRLRLSFKIFISQKLFRNGLQMPCLHICFRIEYEEKLRFDS